VNVCEVAIRYLAGRKAGLENVPFGSAEAEAAGQISLEGVPEHDPLFIRHVEDDIVVLLELLVFLDNRGVVLALPVVAIRPLASLFLEFHRQRWLGAA
jgi:hypothetical protein